MVKLKTTTIITLLIFLAILPQSSIGEDRPIDQMRHETEKQIKTLKAEQKQSVRRVIQLSMTLSVTESNELAKEIIRLTRVATELLINSYYLEGNPTDEFLSKEIIMYGLPEYRSTKAVLSGVPGYLLNRVLKLEKVLNFSALTDQKIKFQHSSRGTSFRPLTANRSKQDN